MAKAARDREFVLSHFETSSMASCRSFMPLLESRNLSAFGTQRAALTAMDALSRRDGDAPGKEGVMSGAVRARAGMRRSRR